MNLINKIRIARKTKETEEALINRVHLDALVMYRNWMIENSNLSDPEALARLSTASNEIYNLSWK
jgi:hypothetical protein